ncbi:ABC-three component system protein [Rhodococcus sp. 06-1474-1B]|uniref:ABC-three component system protein n=1 Tax=Rhodococcus sp. 06-1474-1B TaxID=2022499 RepID=UPI0011407208|nr:ABC-three component system protein [Rhodococcus sp. 06-1474-1B]
MLLTANWRDWYHFRHQQECFKSGVAFEDYVSKVLARFHDDFVNPAPSGTLGDGGCDGLAESGTIFYACYGQRPGRNAERELAAKINSDFFRGLSQWGNFHTWKFVTNAPFGPESAKALTALQQSHGPTSPRPLTIRLVIPEGLWLEVVGSLDIAVLNELFPGAPGAENVELADLLPLLDALDTSGSVIESGGNVLPVPATKMDFNELPAASRLEFNAGRRLAPRIDRWYEKSSDPGLYDVHGERFRSLYRDARGITEVPAEVLERLYVSVAGANFRMDGKRANAAFAVVSYFFDSCHIFETPPSEETDSTEGVPDALTH